LIKSRRLVRKIDFRVLPILVLLFIVRGVLAVPDLGRDRELTCAGCTFSVEHSRPKQHCVGAALGQAADCTMLTNLFLLVSSNAKVSGMTKDLHLTGFDYNNMILVMFVG
jgi:hypothetical protein